MTAADRLDQIAQRAQAATEGPWRVEESRDGSSRSYMVPDVARWRGYRNTLDFGEDRQSAEFVAAAREDVPALVNAIRAVLDLADDLTTNRTAIFNSRLAFGESLRSTVESALGGTQ